jgi:hypothetical protein
LLLPRYPVTEQKASRNLKGAFGRAASPDECRAGLAAPDGRRLPFSRFCPAARLPGPVRDVRAIDRGRSRLAGPAHAGRRAHGDRKHGRIRHHRLAAGGTTFIDAVQAIARGALVPEAAASPSEPPSRTPRRATSNRPRVAERARAQVARGAQASAETGIVGQGRPRRCNSPSALAYCGSGLARRAHPARPVVAAGRFGQNRGHTVTKSLIPLEISWGCCAERGDVIALL